uniref:Pentraxin 4 n=1 Tax=Seriola lalandi dorsalis TaxID=1841481 RepID=A0A3B4WJU4_SERLL
LSFLLCVVWVAALCSFIVCNVDSMLFFPSASAENYVTFALTLPDLPELSVCLWLRVEASHVDPVYRRLPTSLLLDSRWHHLCVLWSSIQGRFWHYSDHRLTSSGSNFRKGWEIPGGGSVVLGQEQDSVGGGFDASEGFAGQVAGFRVWNRVLSPPEVEGVADGRACTTSALSLDLKTEQKHLYSPGQKTPACY